jgi:hypothetical protein
VRTPEANLAVVETTATYWGLEKLNQELFGEELQQQPALPLIAKARTPNGDYDKEIAPSVPGAPLPGSSPGAPALPGTMAYAREQEMQQRQWAFSMNESKSRIGRPADFIMQAQIRICLHQ